MTSREDHFGPLTSMYHVDSLGMRDASCREVPLHSDRPRIMIVGDSFVEGIGVSWEESFVGRLAAALDKRGVEILNAGVASYSPTIYDSWVTHLIRDQGVVVDQVVVFIDISDIKDEHYYHRERMARSVTRRSARFGLPPKRWPGRSTRWIGWKPTWRETL